MPKIQLLDESTINKIAAGEVIERPASVVKELIENSLDAGATEIIIKIKQAGKKQISVIDNGSGMDKDDLYLCIKKHATSKIRKIEDIYSIFSYGFRGEALATISEVSKIEIISGTKDSEVSYKLTVDGKNNALIPQTKYLGTTINVYNLFYNIPARQKFLKSDSYELKKIAELIKTIAIANYKVRFKFYSDEKQIFDFKICDGVKKRIKDVFNLDVFESEYFDPIVNAKVYFTNYSEVKDLSQEKQIFYVNNRAIINKTISFAISKAFESKIPKGKKPNVFVFLELNPKIIDVNVHPQKLEIRVKDNNTFFYPVYNALKNKLEEGLKQNLELQKTKIISLISESKSDYLEVNTTENIKKNLLNNFESENKRLFDIPIETQTKFKILGQYNKTFILVEDENESLLLIDQHVAEERYNYELFLELYSGKKYLEKQNLISPILLDFSFEDLHILDSLKNNFLEFGLEYSILKNELVLRTIPIVLGRIPNKLELKEFFIEIINTLDNNKNKLEDLKNKILTSLACKKSVKADTILGVFEMQKIVDNLFKTKSPYTCPHGRPTIIELSKTEIYKKIGRL
jgi:DNA mismatch repair protein MutL